MLTDIEDKDTEINIPSYHHTRIPEYLTGVDHLSPLVDSLVGRERRTTLNAPFHFFHLSPLSPPENSALSFRNVLLSSEVGKDPSFELWNAISAFPVTANVFSPSSFPFGLR